MSGNSRRSSKRQIGSGRFHHSSERSTNSASNQHQERSTAGSSKQTTSQESARQYGGGHPENKRNLDLSWRRRNRHDKDGDESHSDQRTRKYNPFTYHNLVKLANETSNNDVVKIVANREHNFEGFITNTVRLDVFILIFKVLAKVCMSDYDQSKLEILVIVCESLGLIDSLLSNTMKAGSEKSKEQVMELVSNILLVFETVAKLMPLTACDKLLPVIIGCKFCYRALCEQNHVISNEDNFKRFDDLLNGLNEKKKTENRDLRALKKESFNERMQKLAPPNNFRDISAYPTSNDVLCKNDSVFLRPNLIKGKYDNLEHYLDVHFRLIREDFIRPLRSGIDAYISGDKKKLHETSIRVYKDIRFVRNDDKLVTAIPQNKRNKEIEGILVHFDRHKKYKKIDWQYNKRFMYGSLLCFSRDNFKTLIIGTVSDRDCNHLSAGFLRVIFSQALEENIYQHQYVMVESEVFFEPYLRVLQTLQSLNEENFPLAEYLIYLQEDDFPPAYLDPQNYSPIIYNLPVGSREWPIVVTNSKSWPTPSELELDTSQSLALYGALTRELVIIQGPPGTGKTYIGLRIAEILIKNKIQTGRTTPILVVCLTNHALDQFLVAILKLTNKIIRIGGQSKCEELLNYNLRVIKGQTKSREHLKFIINLREEIKKLQAEVKDFDCCLTNINKNSGIVAHEMFNDAKILPIEAVRAFNNDRFLKWLADEQIDRKGIETVGNVKYCILLEEYDKQIEKLENDKIKNDINDGVLLEINEVQQQLQESKDKMQILLESDEIATQQQYETWVKNLWKLKGYQKWQLYRYWLQQLKDCVLDHIRSKENEILSKTKELNELQIVEDLEILREQDVIGMTTSGAARLHKLLRKLGTEIVIVEEAAEVMEAHVIACLTEKCCHLILIGDHQQLRPQVATYELEKKYSLDVSLFERMVINRGRCITLSVQHRMAPEIADLITPSIYNPKLQNAKEVYNYPEITGIPKRLFFIDHNHLEEMLDSDANSRINRHEANFIVALCRHLILQGYDSSRITILTTYKGQMFHIRKATKEYERLGDVMVQNVDNYQGEENDIVLLSLVRSNNERSIGFLKTENRVCVALSRAKHGLYIVGNMSCLTEAKNVTPENNIWTKIKETLIKQKALGTELTLRCEIHPDQYIKVSTGRDFMSKCPEGGCLQKCTSMLLCTHSCNSICHVLQRDHVEKKCESPCKRLCEANLHLCKKKCFEACGDCSVNVKKTLNCGHQITVKCHIDASTIECDVMVEKVFQPCGHVVQAKCHINPYSTCPCDCDFRLDCGHSCINKCHPHKDPEHLVYQCKKPCARRNAGCSLNHECGKRCCDDCSDCVVKVPKRLKCGHTCHVLCSSDVDSVECNEKCTRTLKCGHVCQRKCKEECDPCTEKITKRTSCGHTIKIECGITPTRKHCSNKCLLKLPCGHPCTSSCNKQCIAKCMEQVAVAQGDCGHMVPLLCWEKQKGLLKPENMYGCKEPCNAILECEHLCPGSCGKCYQGRFHALCDMPCGRVLVCGHTCKQPCAVMCPPCKEKCSSVCIHTKCAKICGAPCTPCMEKCQWQCEHKKCERRCGEICDRDPCDEPCPKRLKCGHDCIGFCSEPCPNLCRTCNPSEVTDILFGDEDEPDARFVYLVDCGHIVEATGMNRWMATNEDMVSKKKCPRCTQPITKSLRFGSEIKQSFYDICNVKKINFGDAKGIENKRQELEAKTDSLIREVKEAPEFHELKWCLEDALKSLAAIINNKTNVFNSTSIRCKEIEVDTLFHICNVWNKTTQLSPEFKEELKHYINLILENLDAKKHRLSQQQVNDFELEILRLQNMFHFFTIKNHTLYYATEKAIVNKLENVVFNFKKRYSKYKHELAQNLLKAIKEEIKFLPGLGITELERVNIVSALQLSQGHWFKCPNGHPYIITECGGAMVESKCNECGAVIGGGRHQLRNDNTHFALMDRSRHPAWSQAANMANYGNFPL